MLDSNVSTYIDKDGNVQEVGSGGTVDASTLNGVITGTNGITTALNTAGDKVEVKIGDKFNVPSNVQFQSTGAYVGFYADNGEFGLKAITSSGEQTAMPFIKGEYKADNTFNFIVQSPAASSGVSITNTGITNWSASEGYAHNFLTEGNVKTINNQSIYGSGNISVGSPAVYLHNIAISYSGMGNSIALQVLMKNPTVITSYRVLQVIIGDTIFGNATGYQRGSIVNGFKYENGKWYVGYTYISTETTLFSQPSGTSSYGVTSVSPSSTYSWSELTEQDFGPEGSVTDNVVLVYGS